MTPKERELLETCQLCICRLIGVIHLGQAEEQLARATTPEGRFNFQGRDIIQEIEDTLNADNPRETSPHTPTG